jgi:hypothetical protein
MRCDPFCMGLAQICSSGQVAWRRPFGRRAFCFAGALRW